MRVGFVYARKGWFRFEAGDPTDLNSELLSHEEDEGLVNGLRADDVIYPAIVKPIAESSSIGIDLQAAIVQNPAEARRRTQVIISRYHQPAIVEMFIEGIELEILVVADGADEMRVRQMAECGARALGIREYDRPAFGIDNAGKAWFNHAAMQHDMTCLPMLDGLIQAGMRRHRVDMTQPGGSQWQP